MTSDIHHLPVAKGQRTDIKTGFSCNNRCRFCVQGDKRTEYADKTTSELVAAITEARTHSSAIVLTGGEVTIRKDLPVLVSHAKSLGFEVIQIQTNGRMMAVESALDRLIEAGATEFAPALHGHTAEIHDALTRAPGAFRQTVRGILNVKKRGLPVLLNTVLTRQNADHLLDMTRLFLKLRVDQFQLAFVHGIGAVSEDYETMVPRFSEIQDQVLASIDLAQTAGVRCMTEAIPLCFLPGHERFAAEWIIPHTRIVDAEWVIDDFTDQRWTQGKVRGEVCQACDWQGQCEGPWRDYPEHYGWEEFRPVRDRKPTSSDTSSKDTHF